MPLKNIFLVLVEVCLRVPILLYKSNDVNWPPVPPAHKGVFLEGKSNGIFEIFVKFLYRLG